MRLQRLLGSGALRPRDRVRDRQPANQGLSQEDLAWLLGNVPAEVLILRPAPDDSRRITASGSTATSEPLAASAATVALRERSSATATTTPSSTLPMPIT